MGNDQIQTVLDFLDKHGKINDRQISELLGLKRTRTYILAKEMCDEGLIMAISEGQNKLYIRLK